MDPIGAITTITAGVMRRIADAIDNSQTDTQPAGAIHIGEIHIHCDHQDANLDTSAGKARTWMRRR